MTFKEAFEAMKHLFHLIGKRLNNVKNKEIC